MQAQFDRIAFLHDKLLFISIATEKGRVKQFRALLSGEAKGVSLSINGPVCYKPSELDAHGNPISIYSHGRSCNPSKEGYTSKKKDLDHGMSHITFAAKDVGFMLTYSHIALFKQIRRSSVKNPITTPFIPEWLEWMSVQLRAEHLLEEAYCHRCNCSMFSAGTKSLERIIKHGLEEGLITIPPPPKIEKTHKSISYLVPQPTN